MKIICVVLLLACIFSESDLARENAQLRRTNEALLRALGQTQSKEQSLGMDKTELIGSIASEAGLTTTQATVALEATVESITDTLQSGDQVQIIGFGTFQVRRRAARSGRNPKTGEEIFISEAIVPTFTPGSVLKAAVNGAQVLAKENARLLSLIEARVGISKGELINDIASRAGLTTEQATNALQAFVDTITTALVNGDQVQIIGFGTFKVNYRPARIGRNPKTGAEILIAVANVPAFVAGPALKEAVNGAESEAQVLAKENARLMSRIEALVGSN